MQTSDHHIVGKSPLEKLFILIKLFFPANFNEQFKNFTKNDILITKINIQENQFKKWFSPHLYQWSKIDVISNIFQMNIN